MSSPSRQGSQNFDSLLDTMANVVGILVVVMAFTQLQIGEAVRRIHHSETQQARTADEALALAGEAALREAGRLEDALQTRTESNLRVRNELQQLSLQFAELNPKAHAPGVVQADVVAGILRENQLARSQDHELSALRARQEQLEIRLRGAKDSLATATHQVRLPDPRPAPTGADERVFFCRYGRIIPVNLDRLHAILNTGLRASSGSPLAGGFDASLLVSHFEGHDIGNRNFRWHLSDRAGLGVAARLAFRHEEAGELRSELAADDSRYRLALRRAAPETHYLRFYVWSDSFATYLHARRIAEDMGFAVGWQAYDRRAEHEGILATHVPPDSAIPID